jgi:hypothetical protein
LLKALKIYLLFDKLKLELVRQICFYLNRQVVAAAVAVADAKNRILKISCYVFFVWIAILFL